MPDQGGAQEAVFSRRLSVDDAARLEGRIEATSAECARVAAFCGIENLDGFRFAYRLQPLASHRYRLTGELSADVTQACIVTLEPVEERVREAVAAEFWPENQLEALTREEDETAESAPSEAPEPIIAGKIDIGAFAVEILASAINPYPRKADAEFVWDEGEAEKTGPFAALAKLRQDR